MAYESKPWVGQVPVGQHWICSCGESGNKPYCDGSHQRCNTGLNPNPLAVEGEAEQVALCMCGHTGTPPRCDGSHKDCDPKPSAARAEA